VFYDVERNKKCVPRGTLNNNINLQMFHVEHFIQYTKKIFYE